MIRCPAGCLTPCAHIAGCLDPDATLRHEDDPAERYAALVEAFDGNLGGVTLADLTRYIRAMPARKEEKTA